MMPSIQILKIFISGKNSVRPLEKALQIRVAWDMATEREVPMPKPTKASLLGTSPTHLTQNGWISGFQWD